MDNNAVNMAERFPRLLDNPLKFEDNRGFLEVLYESDATVLKRSFSKKGVFRGMHVQKGPHYQTKLIRIISGKIIDFIVDIESDDKQVYYNEITVEDQWVKIDKNYGHGFYALEDTVFEYICDGAYNEQAEIAFNINEFLAKKMQYCDFVISKKDADAKPLEQML